MIAPDLTNRVEAKMRIFGTALAATILLAAMPLSAQSAPQARTIPVQFTGVVTNEISDTIKIRQPDGSLTTFTGPIPDYPYQKGDTVTISFNTQLPTKAYYDAYAGQQSADGIYKIRVQGRNSSTVPFFGGVRDVDISGPAQLSGQDGFGIRDFFLVFDSNADTYSLDFPTGEWTLGPVDFPTYSLDGASGQLTPRNSSCFGVQCESTGTGFRGNSSSASVNFIPIVKDPGLGEFVGGFFNLSFAGAWNLPTFGNGSGGGDPVDVPEPASVLFFGAGAGLLGWRRRRALRKVA
jgi:PEP-CTERM motif